MSGSEPHHSTEINQLNGLPSSSECSSGVAKPPLLGKLLLRSLERLLLVPAWPRPASRPVPRYHLLHTSKKWVNGFVLLNEFFCIAP